MRDKTTVIWGAIIGLSFLSVWLGLASVPSAAIQYWYLNFSPLILAAYRFGLRGALLGSLFSMMSVLWFYQAAQAVNLPTLSDLEALIPRVTSTEEVQALVGRLADLRAKDPYTNFIRATSGSFLLIISSILVGILTDRTRAQEVENRAGQRLRRFLSPGVAEAILSGEQTFELSSTRREISILFADLRGFTTLSERMEPEELSRLLNEYLASMTEVIFRHDGTVDKYIGDGIMAIFGDPVPSLRHEENALRAALEMRGKFYELLSTWYLEGRETITLGVGVQSGFATVGNFGTSNRLEHTAIGTNVNLASRLSDLATPGQILTTQRTYAKSRHFIEARSVGQLEVNGLAHPADVVEILGYRLVPIGQSDNQGEESTLLERTIERMVEDASFRALVIRDTEQALKGLEVTEAERAIAHRIAELIGYPLFAGVPSDEVRRLLRLATVERFAEGVVITHQGEKEAKFYTIYSGEATVLAIDAQGMEQHVATLGRGNHFGELALLHDRPRNATIRAGAGLELLTLDPQSFQQLMTSCAKLAENVKQEAAKRLPLHSEAGI